MESLSPSDFGSDQSSVRLPTSAPSSPPPTDPSGSFDMEEPHILEEELKARISNDAEEKKRTISRKRKRKALTKAEREAKARDLDDLLARSAGFSDILTKKTNALGQVGTGFDGNALGGHNLTMAEQPKSLVGGTMRDYQREGLTWMYEVCLQGMSGILADEMGLGKTVQTISLLALLRDQESLFGPHLIVAPLSTLSNWLNEFHMWAPSIPVVMYHGTPTERKELYASSLLKHMSNGRPSAKFPVVCTSYEIVLRDRSSLSKIKWEFIIIDEGHRMKNFESKLFRELQLFKSETRFLITGTPLQNNLRELWSLLNFLMPKVFADWDAFDSWFDFDGLEDEEATKDFIADEVKQDLVKKIHRVLQPLLLRRVKADVAAYLPKKREYILYAPMTKEQTDLYNVIRDKNIDTRTYLEGKVVEHLTSERNTPAASRKASPQRSRSQATKSKSQKAHSVGDAIKLSVRSSPRAKKTQEPSPARPNAFALMMAKSQPRGRPKSTNVVVEISTPVKIATKRKNPLTEEAQSKSAKSSRNSTPSASRGRTMRNRRSYKEADTSDEELLSDDEFEAKLAREIAGEDAGARRAISSADEFVRSKTLDIAKMEMANKKLGNPLMQLRLVCNSPHNFYNPWSYDVDRPVDEDIVTASGKMLLLDRLLLVLFMKGHKVLIFSQFKTQLDILHDYCRDLRKWPVCRIDGSVSQDERRQQIEVFNGDPDYKIFLLSTRAGGQGINLTGADTVILFDSDWNPQQDLQAQDRCHRIGQTRPVIVYRLATKGTVEEQLLMSADAKRRLEKLVIKKGRFQTLGQKMDTSPDFDKETLQSLLLKDGQVYTFSGDKEILSNEDLRLLCDRSDEAYDRAARGDGDADAFRVVETGVNGITLAQRTS